MLLSERAVEAYRKLDEAGLEVGPAAVCMLRDELPPGLRQDAENILSSAATLLPYINRQQAENMVRCATSLCLGSLSTLAIREYSGTLDVGVLTAYTPIYE